MSSTDHAKAIIASLFKPSAPGVPPAEEYIAHLQTFEDVAGSAARKPRFLIISAARGGALMLHKAKQNSNGTFSTGKTWAMEDLRGVEVVQSLEFVLTINGKSYRYETALPSALQAAFLVTLVRCWRAYMAGKNQADIHLVGFNVSPATNRSTLSPQMTSSATMPSLAPPPTNPPRMPSPQPSRSERIDPPRPSTSQSTRSVESIPASTAVPKLNIPSRSNVSPPINAQRPSTAPLSVNKSNERSHSSSSTSQSATLAPARSQNDRPVLERQPSSFRTPTPPPPQNSNQFPSSTVSFVPPPPPDASYSSADTIDEETVLANVEEMLEGFEWRGAVSSSGWGGSGGMTSGRADEIEKRLVGELKALEAASIHAIIESDDRVTFVVENLDDAIAELDRLDAMFKVYQAQLNVMNDEIAHIEGQNRGLQVQTSNQRSLLAELDNLMDTIRVAPADLDLLSQESLKEAPGIERLERAAVSLYKALLSTRDSQVGEMAAASERVEEYRTRAAQFCQRVYDYLAIMFKVQVDQLVHGKNVLGKKSELELPSHAAIEDALGLYCGLMLFVKEIDQGRYQQICASYFTSMSELHRTEIHNLLTAFKGQIRKPSDEDLEATFSPSGASPTLRQGTIRRAGTMARTFDPGSSKREKEKEGSEGKFSGSQAFNIALSQLAPHIAREQGFIADLLHINPLDASITFADYMMLDTYFRRGATSYLATQQAKLKEIRSAMEMVFGFLEAELRSWIETVLAKDTMQIVGVLAALDRVIQSNELDRNDFLPRMLQKQHTKLIARLEESCKEQLKAIEQTKLTLKKRKGVVPFVKIFSLFVARVEAQLTDADGLRIREIVDANYERIAATMFDSLQHMAKMDGEGTGVAGEDKDQLNYHVILIENMHHLTLTLSKQHVPALVKMVAHAKEKYTENLDLYIKLVLRRFLAKLLDFFQGLEQILRTTPATEVSLHSNYTRSALKRTTASLSAKDLRKAIDVLYKRVDKHFGMEVGGSAGSGTMLKTVWKACEEELRGLTEGWKGLIETCYPDEKGLEFTRDDISNDFKRAQMTS